MDYLIEHELPGRMRIRLAGPVPDGDLDAFTTVLEEIPCVERAVVYPRIGSAAVSYRPTAEARDTVARHLSLIDADAIDQARSRCVVSIAPRTHALMLDLATLVGSHFIRKLFMPLPLRAAWAAWRYRLFLKAALRSLGRSRLDVPVLDAAAIGMSFLKRDPKTASETMLLLDIGETLEDYTRARSENELIHSLLAAPETAQRIEGDQETRVPSSELAVDDLVVVRTGMPVCVDGVVERGVAMVNQSTLTGEPLAVERTVGDDVFAGTAVEEGEIFVRVRSCASDTKLRSIVSLVELSESLKAGAQTRRERLADAIVPWNFLLAGAVALATRSLAKTSAALMVDYSCALKLTGSIAVLSAMSQSAKAGFTVKGSRCFEEFAASDTIVFDKTGTLTEATPQVACVIALDGWNRGQILRLAACLEEHFPHPVARAVVRAGDRLQFSAARGRHRRYRDAASIFASSQCLNGRLEPEELDAVPHQRREITLRDAATALRRTGCLPLEERQTARPSSPTPRSWRTPEFAAERLVERRGSRVPDRLRHVGDAHIAFGEHATRHLHPFLAKTLRYARTAHLPERLAEA